MFNTSIPWKVPEEMDLLTTFGFLIDLKQKHTVNKSKVPKEMDPGFPITEFHYRMFNWLGLWDIFYFPWNW